MHELPERSDVVVIGGVAAGPKAAATLARRQPEAIITLFHKEEHLSYAACGFPLYASGEVGSFEELLKTPYGVLRDAEFFESSKGFRTITRAEVTRIDRRAKTVTVRMIETGEVVEHGYDRLVIATGSTPKEPPMPLPKSNRVRPFVRPIDVITFRQHAERGEVDSVAIIGGGFIGIELCETAKDMWGIEVDLFEKQPQLFPYMLDPEMATIVQNSLVREGVRVLTGAQVDKIDLNSDDKPVVYVTGHEPVSVDYVFLCLGVHPEVTLARECGLDIGETGGIRVNECLQTSDPDVYAGGDCIESLHQITGRSIYLPMGSLANRHGRVIGEMLAGNKVEFPGVVGAFVLRAFETNIGGVGLSERAARDAGLEARAVWGSFPDKPDYNPEVKTFTLKMVYEDRTNRLLGVQAVGTGDIARRVDVFSSLLQRGATLEDLFDFEHGYAPRFAEALDPLHHMAGMAAAGLRGTEFVDPGSLPAAVDQGTLVLDVRETDEAVGEPLPPQISDKCNEVIRIPLGELKSRLKELDPTKRILIICRRGSRSYQAAVILEAAGIESFGILAAGLQAQE
ncbi:MAG: FAD-dependent oxidoreductase [Candidatus Latescibacterota bacterium]|nr:MAG: FAD-dependent oxidoreductase [Candidatus Latescibacterota bacterium]